LLDLPSRINPLHVALTYNQKKEGAVQNSITPEFAEPPAANDAAAPPPESFDTLSLSPSRSDDRFAEWDTPETIEAVRAALAEVHRVTLIEADENFYDTVRRIRPDIVFNIAEGLNGVSREAQVPAMLDMLRIPYSGSDPVTLSLCLDKSRTKEILSHYGVPTARFSVVETMTDLADAGVKLPATVSFGTQKIPHARHVAEFGAVCTACHSPEVHKAVTAKPATCTACHHSPANERCESCHRVQSAFYRGTTKTALAKVGPNVMVNTVGCTGCHDMAKKHSRQAVGDTCVSCHDAAYTGFLTEWTAGTDQEIARTAAAVRRAEALARGGRVTAEVRAAVKEAGEALALVRRARPVHNPDAAAALLEAARKKVEAIDGMNSTDAPLTRSRR